MSELRDKPTPHHVELLYFEGCPSYKTAWLELLEIISEHDLDVTVRPIKVDSLEKAKTLHFAGSPSLKVNAVDLEHYEGTGVMACRVYEENGGKGWPSKNLLERRLLEEKQRYERT